jgi:hypothetical protein
MFSERTFEADPRCADRYADLHLYRGVGPDARNLARCALLRTVS